jgi:predicted CoA-substrate-specific enzyme activase
VFQFESFKASRDTNGDSIFGLGVKMLSAGIDIGAENVKLVVLNGDKLLTYSIVPSGWDTKASLQHAFNEAVEMSGVDSEAIRCVGATGMGRESVSFATTYATDSTCSAKGATWLIHSARTVIDIGAEQSQALTCDGTGRVLEYIRNENCAAGVGAFIEEIASALELRIADMGELSLRSEREITINSTCAIFAESEVISLINEGANKADIARAVSDAIASKAASLLQCVNIKKDVVFIGGVAKNIGVVNSLGRKLNLDILVPEEPSLVTAAGAALIAQQAGGKQ